MKINPSIKNCLEVFANFRFVIKVFMFEIFNFGKVAWKLRKFFFLSRSLFLSAHSFFECTNNFDSFNLEYRISYLFSLVQYFELPNLKQWNKKFCIYILCNIKYCKGKCSNSVKLHPFHWIWVRFTSFISNLIPLLDATMSRSYLQ